MTASDRVTLYYSPRTRAKGVRVLLEELGAPYDLHALNMAKGEQRAPDYLVINPLGKVPAIRHGDALVTEQSAIYIYLADAFPDAGLALAIGEPDRGAFLRWIVFYSSCFEPALIDKSMGREPPPASRSAYGSFETVIDAIQSNLSAQAFMAGDRFTAADLLWGGALRLMTGFGLVPRTPVFDAYIEKTTSRPSFRKVAEEDEIMAAAHDEEAAGAA
ncbi:glutathione S-transferase family protein [Hoeflea sp. WL0058]|uniref:Glutathione S-transferase family protein n=1 Tax=Flavimaribacter sediminis TaxID=2865987 RepID=A0AAE2ZUV6_9HYPH|nr:glutathione S-transferase family protein [Flavimaribacter sediminis]MBW8640082.1 glutathione S-transferase family protein [Flavimaribacter sediminis]